MRKILFLDGNITPNETSYSRSILDKMQEVANSYQNVEVMRFDLNKTKHAEIFLTGNNLSTYWNDIDADYWINLL
ncbi:hypothetical protein [Mycoplasmopsis gallopavonis]|uniref:Azoreductase n=1 Tax=Mycoplasmopsis gallopavonis TaxID=76629 RepID=A0A449B081_9BACT|nr:hypothetical protein [Mycoplasmopsis gallopavonis]RIV16855.1 hypothetical protein D1113_00740 [Mycoplasmopsis gallopavonis]VEU73159.1 azoreductase [Mycoplasmopsis gallopavonis]